MQWSAAAVAAALSRPGKGKSRKKGSSWMALCPAHTDEKPSLHLTDGRKGLLWHCHAGCAQDDVRDALKETLAGRTVDRRETVKNAREIICVPHVPSEIEYGRITNLDFVHGLMGRPSRVWTYRSERAAPLMYVARYDMPDGKEILPWSWQSVDGMAPKFMSKAWPEGRPLFNLDKLAANPNAPVLYVEGEKAARAAEKLFPAFVVTTHQGGGKALAKADLTPLRGRLVVIQPDADEPGDWLADQLTLALGNIARRILRLDWPTAWPHGDPYPLAKGADCADHVDAGWTRDMLAEMKAAGTLKMYEPDLSFQFGEGVPTANWGSVTVTDEKASLVAGGSVIATTSGNAWRAVVTSLEADFNRRLMAQGCERGRFPRHRNTVDVAPFMISEIFGIMSLLAVSEDPHAVIEHHMRLSPFARGVRWRDLERMNKRAA